MIRDVINELKKYIAGKKNTDKIKISVLVLNRLIFALEEQEPKTGHWIAQDIHNCHTDFKCSACGYIHSFMHIYGEPTADYTYCPNCGAKMQEVEE